MAPRWKATRILWQALDYLVKAGKSLRRKFATPTAAPIPRVIKKSEPRARC
jgi:hypothetical protein